MRKQRFSELVADRGLPHGSVLKTVEHLVVDNHRRLHAEFMGQSWSAPAAYRWMRYENPDPVSQLEEASNSLERLWKGAAASDSARADELLLAAAEHEEKHLAEVAPVVRGLGLKKL